MRCRLFGYAVLAGSQVVWAFLGSGCGAPAVETPVQVTDGRGHFLRHCVTCHAIHGRGVPMAFPALLGSDVVAGDPERLVRVLLQTPGKVLGDRGYSAVMPAFAMPGDADLAAIVTFIRWEYAGRKAGVDAAFVAGVRARIAAETN